MDIELNQLASAMLVLVFAAVMLVTGLLFIERSARRFDSHNSANKMILRATDNVFTRDGVKHASAVMRAMAKGK